MLFRSKLFNIYINQLPNAIHPNHGTIDLQDTDPITIRKRLIKCLLYADDLVLFSTTAEGLNKQLQNLHDYCVSLDLEVSIAKTEAMYIKSRKSQAESNTNLPRISYNGQPIAYADTFKYVGITISHDGKYEIGRAHV